MGCAVASGSLSLLPFFSLMEKTSKVIISTHSKSGTFSPQLALLSVALFCLFKPFDSEQSLILLLVREASKLEKMDKFLPYSHVDRTRECWEVLVDHWESQRRMR